MYENAQYMKPWQSPEPMSIQVDINGVTSCVPLDPANTDYQNIMLMVQAGTLTIAPALEHDPQ